MIPRNELNRLGPVSKPVTSALAAARLTFVGVCGPDVDVVGLAAALRGQAVDEHAVHAVRGQAPQEDPPRLGVVNLLSNLAVAKSEILNLKQEQTGISLFVSYVENLQLKNNIQKTTQKLFPNDTQKDHQSI